MILLTNKKTPGYKPEVLCSYFCTVNDIQVQDLNIILIYMKCLYIYEYRHKGTGREIRINRHKGTIPEFTGCTYIKIS